MPLEDKVHAFCLHVLQRAQELGNVSAACRKAGISRTLFYRWKKRLTLYVIAGLHPFSPATHPGRPIHLDTTTEGGLRRWHCLLLRGVLDDSVCRWNGKGSSSLRRQCSGLCAGQDWEPT